MDNLKNKVFSGFAWKFAERILVQGVTFVVSLVIARILEPEDYGLLGMILVYINIATVIVVNGFNAALIQNQQADEKDFSTIFYISLIISIVLYGIIYLLAPFIAGFYNQDELTNLLRVLSLILPISSLSSIQNAYIGRNMIFRKTFFASFIASVISGVIGILLALKGFGTWALVFQMIVANLITCIVQLFIVPWKPKLFFEIKKTIPLLKFGANSLGADFIGTIFNQLNSFIMGKWYSASELAYYNRGYGFPALISGNVSTIISSVLFPAFSKKSADISNIKDTMRKSTKIYAYVLTPFYVGLIAVSNNLISVLITDKWLPCVPYLCIICFANILGTISPLDVIALKSIGRSDIVFKLEFIKKPIWLLFIIVASFINSYALTFVLVLSTVMEMIVNGIAIDKVMGYSIKEKVLDWLVMMIPSIIMFIGIYFLRFIQINKVIILILQIIMGVAIYIVFSILTKNECYLYLLNIIKNKIKKNN